MLAAIAKLNYVKAHCSAPPQTSTCPTRIDREHQQKLISEQRLLLGVHLCIRLHAGVTCLTLRCF